MHDGQSFPAGGDVGKGAVDGAGAHDPFRAQIIANEQFYQMAMDAIVRRVGERVDDKLDRRHARAAAVWGLAIPAALGVLGLLGASFAALAIDREVDRRVSALFEERLDAVGERIDGRIDARLDSRLVRVELAAQLSLARALADRIARAPRLDEAEAREAIEVVAGLHERHVEPGTAGGSARMRAALGEPFDALVAAFAGAGRPDLVQALAEAAPRLAAGDAAVAAAMVRGLGPQLIGAAGAAAAWDAPGDMERDALMRHRAAAAEARGAGHAGLVAVHEGILRMMEGAPEREVAEVVDDLDDLAPTGREEAGGALRSLLAGGPATGTAEGRRVAARTRAFITRFADRSETLAAIAADLPAQD